MTDCTQAVRRRAHMIDFGSVEEFRPRANNFYLMFLRMPEHILNIYRFRPAFHRFAERYPDRVLELEQALEDEGRSPGERSWPLLLESYNLMAELVDIDDKGVIPPSHLPYPEINPDTGVDELCLTR